MVVLSSHHPRRRRQRTGSPATCGWTASPMGPGRISRLATVRFSPGARTAWHCHAHRQTSPRHRRPGARPEQRRAHDRDATWRHRLHPARRLALARRGAPMSFMTHLALADSSSEAGATDVEWAEHVSDDEYEHRHAR